MDMRTAINLVESNLSDDTLDAVVDEVVKEFLSDEFQFGDAVARYGRDEDIDGLDVEDGFGDRPDQRHMAQDPGFRTWLKRNVVERVSEVYWEIESRVKGGTLIGYRVITAPTDFHYDGTRHPGIYWSWDDDAAEAHWGDFSAGMVSWKFTAKIPVASIDWQRTLVMSASPNYEEEKEIRLFDNAPLEVVSLEQVG